MTDRELELDLLVHELESSNSQLQGEVNAMRDREQRLIKAISELPFGDTAMSFAVFVKDFK